MEKCRLVGCLKNDPLPPPSRVVFLEINMQVDSRWEVPGKYFWSSERPASARYAHQRLQRFWEDPLGQYQGSPGPAERDSGAFDCIDLEVPAETYETLSREENTLQSIPRYRACLQSVTTQIIVEFSGLNIPANFLAHSFLHEEWFHGIFSLSKHFEARLKRRTQLCVAHLFRVTEWNLVQVQFDRTSRRSLKHRTAEIRKRRTRKRRGTKKKLRRSCIVSLMVSAKRSWLHFKRLWALL